VRTYFEFDDNGNANKTDALTTLYGEAANEADLSDPTVDSSMMMAGTSRGGSVNGWYKCVCNQGTGGNCASAASTLCRDNTDSIRSCFRTLYEGCR